MHIQIVGYVFAMRPLWGVGFVFIGSGSRRPQIGKYINPSALFSFKSRLGNVEQARLLVSFVEILDARS